MDDYWHRRWACPYYVRSGRLTVECECGSRLRFPDDCAAMRYFGEFCADVAGWKRCTVAQTLERMYEAGENRGPRRNGVAMGRGGATK